MTIWTEASSEVLALAQRMIDQWHPDLQDATIGFLFRDKASSSAGRDVIGHSAKVSPSLRPFLDYDFIIWVSEKDWSAMTSERKEALLDHQLTHCRMFDGKADIRGHDVEEFHVIIARHGLWTDNLMGLGEQVRQLTLPMEVEAASHHDGNVVTIPAEKIVKINKVIQQALDIVEQREGEHGQDQTGEA